MSQDEVELARRAIEAFNSGDLATIAATYDWYQPDFEFLDGPGPATARGHRGADAIESYFRQFLDLFDDYAIEIEEIVDAGDQVVVFNRQRAAARGGGAQVDVRSAWIFAFRGGKISHITPYWDRARALEAVGLTE